MESTIRCNWTKEEIKTIYNTPLIDLIYKAASIHREYHNPLEVQVSSLLSIKTGGCTEDCSYCSQSARYKTEINVHKLLSVQDVIESAKNAKAGGSSRFCMGAAWREVRDNKDFEKILEMVREVNNLDMEVCCTLGMITESQAKKLEEAGLYAYNHNLDTSEENYNNVITTRTYQDRLDTLGNVRKTKITVCSGGIIGLGETEEDRISMLYTLSRLSPHPESVPINALVPIDGTPLEVQSTISTWDMIRMIATTRIVLPKSDVRLSAGRKEMNMEAQALCFMAGANSIFAGDKLLTTPNPDFDQDKMMFELLGLMPRASYSKQTKEVHCC